MKRRSQRVLAATAVIVLFSSLLGKHYWGGVPDLHADSLEPAMPFPNASWQQTLMSGRW